MQTYRASKDLNPKEASELNRQKILRAWMRSGLEDFYLSFELEEKWQRHSTFYCHQGLEKICKTYHIAKYLKQLKNFNAGSVLKQVDRIARSLNHELSQMVKCLQSRRILPTYTASRPYSEDDLLQGLEAAYTEVRYPVPYPFHLTRDQHGKERFRIQNSRLKMYHDPLAETAPLAYARSMARTLLKKIETEFEVRIPDSKVSSKISDKDWKRFTNIFLIARPMSDEAIRKEQRRYSSAPQLISPNRLTRNFRNTGSDHALLNRTGP
jgi:hypothetical protein